MSFARQLPLTFGVEFEFVFAIHNDIVPGHHMFNHGNHQWLAEVLNEIAFEPNGLQVVLEEPQDCDGYEQWILTYDFSARIESNLMEHFRHDKRINPDTLADWNHDGMELISRVLTVPDLSARGYLTHHPSILEINEYLKHLHADGRVPWFARPTRQCGLHVHIGVPGLDFTSTTVDQIPLNILQHLAYLLIQYEDIISCLNHPQRRGFFDTNEFIGSNKMGINGHQRTCDQNENELESIQNIIFSLDLADLADLMGSSPGVNPYAKRYKFVNWENIRRYNSMERTDKPPTLEFRQHEATLDIVDVSQWVSFLTALMRLAERRANEATPPNSPTKPPIPRDQLTYPQREGGKYRFRCTNVQDRTEELFDLLHLDRGQRVYWLKRFNDYNPNEFTNMPYAQQCIECGVRESLGATDRKGRRSFDAAITSAGDTVEEGRGVPVSPEAPFSAIDMSTRERLIAEAGAEILWGRQTGLAAGVIRRSVGRSSVGTPHGRVERWRARRRAGHESAGSFTLGVVPRRRGVRTSPRKNSRVIGRSSV